MRKVNLLIMSGALGLLCAGSTAVLAQSTPPAGSKTNAGETKPPFVIPNGGNFKYKGKSSQGEILLMEVKWQAAGAKPDGTIRISGDVKYKNPKTEKIDVRTIDGDNSYITKTGELFFALNDVDAKVYGPVDLAALKDASLAKSDKPSEDKGSGPVSPGKETPSADDQKLSRGPSTNPDAPTELELDTDAERKDISSSLAASKNCAFFGTEAYDDRFRASGKLKTSSGTFFWRQDATKTNADGTKNVDVVVNEDRQCKILNGRSYLSKDGNIHFQHKFKRKFISARYHTYSTNNLLLARAENLIKKEYKLNYNKDVGFFRAKRGTRITTEGGLLLGGVAKAIGVEKIGHKQTPLGTEAFNTIHDLLKLNNTFVVHRMADFIGLKVDAPPNKRRRLMNGTQGLYRYLCYDCPDADDVFDGAVPRIQALEDGLMAILERHVNRHAVAIPQNAVNRGIDLARRELTDRNIEYEHNWAVYLARLRALFRQPLNNVDRFDLQRTIQALADHGRRVRAGTMGTAEYYRMRNNEADLVRERLGRHLLIEPDAFVNLLVNNIPGLAGDDRVEVWNRYRPNTLQRLVRAELLRLQRIRFIPRLVIFEHPGYGKGNPGGDGGGNNDVAKLSLGIAVDSNIVGFQ